jgi:L-asparaginase
MSTATKRVGVIGLGGTIAMQAASGGLALALGAGDLAAAVVADCGALAIDWSDFARVPSANIGFADLIRLAAQIEHMQGKGYHGVVVSQGTDTLEETAFALELLVRAPIDIVLTGAMRGNSAPGADGAANLLGALRFLQESAGHGEVVVVLDDCVHAARHVDKHHTTALSAFGSGEFGLRGRIHEGRFVALNPARTALPKIGATGGAGVPHVELVTIGLDQQPWIFRTEESGAVDGWVIAALGAGHVPEALVPDLHRLAGDVPVILCSRTGGGPVCSVTYGYPGGEIDLLRRGLVHGGNLSPAKARVLLTLLLMDGAGDCRARFAAVAAAI